MNRPHGFAIVSAIFILVVLAMLGAFILNISASQHVGSALDVQGVRAYQSARAGIEWGLYQVQSSNGFDDATPNARACPAATTSFALPAGATVLAGFTVTVTCTRTPVDDTPANNPNNSPAVYSVVATACNEPVAGWTASTVACPNTANPGSYYVERRLAVAF